MRSWLLAQYKFFQYGIITFILLYNTNLLASKDVERLSCVFYDTENPHDGNGSFSLGLPSVWARGLANEYVYVEGKKQNGFFEASNISGKVMGMLGQRVVANYENSPKLAEAFCKKAFKAAFPADYENKELVRVETKSSFLSFKSTPIVFDKQYNNMLIKFNKFIIFGDSLSDDGNFYRDHFGLFPPVPYFKGHFSDRFVWNEYLRKLTGIAIQNRAVGGAISDRFIDPEYNRRSFSEKIRSSVQEFVSGNVKAEINKYKRDVLKGGTLSDAASTAVFIWVGGNDYIGIIERDEDADTFIDEPQDERIGSNAVAKRVVNNILANINKLYEDIGARNFIVPNLPDLGSVPRILVNKNYHRNSYETEHEKFYNLSTKMTAITQLHNDLLDNGLKNFKNQHPDSNFVFIDIFKALRNVNHSMSLEDSMSHFDYGLLDNAYEISLNNQNLYINNACYLHEDFSFDGAEMCAEPSNNLIFDTIHPTSFGHCLLAYTIHNEAAKNNILGIPQFSDYLNICKPSIVK